ncbi:MAG: ATP-binding protein, partial [Desulfobacterales bacterium]
MLKIKLPARIESLGEFIQSVSSLAERLRFSQESIQKIQLALEETLVNIFHYAFPDGTGEVTVTCRQEDEK